MPFFFISLLKFWYRNILTTDQHERRKKCLLQIECLNSIRKQLEIFSRQILALCNKEHTEFDDWFTKNQENQMRCGGYIVYLFELFSKIRSFFCLYRTTHKDTLNRIYYNFTICCLATYSWLRCLFEKKN